MCSIPAVATVVFLLGTSCAAPTASPSPESRALDYLAREVPRWRPENGCFSCHHDGDAARTLFVAARLGEPLPPATLDGTAAWLSRPGEWRNNPGDPAASDPVLAAVQFAGALLAGRRAGVVADRSADALRGAAELLARCQEEDGSWRVGAAGVVGSPITHGPHLATATALAVIEASADATGASTAGLDEAAARARRWLAGAPVRNVVEAASILLAPASVDASAPAERRARCLELLRAAESQGGGWGPYTGSAPEPFDTALVLLALAALPPSPELRAMVARGRAFLLATQEPGGAWPETTRPPGARSLAHRVSTTAWAARALLETR